VNVADAFAPSEWTLDTTDPSNPVLQIMKYGKIATFPVSTDMMTKTYSNGYSRTYKLNGIVVYAPMNGNVYIPQEAINLLR
jgi:hypothetical protein